MWGQMDQCVPGDNNCGVESSTEMRSKPATVPVHRVAVPVARDLDKVKIVRFEVCAPEQGGHVVVSDGTALIGARLGQNIASLPGRARL